LGDYTVEAAGLTVNQMS